MDEMSPLTKTPTRDELLRMLKQCDENVEGNVWNWMVADLLRHYLELRKVAETHRCKYSDDYPCFGGGQEHECSLAEAIGG